MQLLIWSEFSILASNTGGVIATSDACLQSWQLTHHLGMNKVMPVSELAPGVSRLVFEALCGWSLVCLPAMCYASQSAVFSASLEKCRLLLWCLRSPSLLFMLHLSIPSCSCLRHALWFPWSLIWKALAPTPCYNFPWVPQPKRYLGSAPQPLHLVLPSALGSSICGCTLSPLLWWMLTATSAFRLEILRSWRMHHLISMDKYITPDMYKQVWPAA